MSSQLNTRMGVSISNGMYYILTNGLASHCQESLTRDSGSMSVKISVLNLR